MKTKTNLRHPERLNVYGVDDPFALSFVVWLFGEAIGLAGLVGLVAVVARWLMR